MQLFSAKNYKETYEGTQRCSLMYNRFIIEQSDTAAHLILALRSFDLSDTTELLVIKLLQKLTKQSPLLGQKMLENGAAKLLVRRLQSWSFESEQVFRTVEIIWNLHDSSITIARSDPESTTLLLLVDQLADIDSLAPLHNLFVYHLHKPFSAASRQLRNDALVLASLVAKYRPSSAFLETGFGQLLLNLATLEELGGKSTLAVANNREDFELKKLLINFASLIVYVYL